MLAVALLGGLQLLASVALRDRAQAGSWVTLLSSQETAGLSASARRLPLPPVLRLAFAREAFASGDYLSAAHDLASLRGSPDALALRAALERARGDGDAAARDDLAAGDFEAFAEDLDRLAATGRLERALELARAAVARLSLDRTEPDSLAQAQYGLGILEEARAQTYPSGSARRRRHAEAAAAAYAAAVELGPLDERYLLAAGNQALNLGSWNDAAATFGRAAALDPTSADPIASMGDLAYRRGDRAAARSYLARARALDPRSAAVTRLAAKLGS